MTATLSREATGVNAARGLTRDRWAAYFDALNRRDDLWVTIEVEGDRAGGTEARRLPLDSVTFEDRDDQIAIGVGGHDERWPAVLWHYAEHPRHVHVAEHDRDPVTLTITSNDGTRTVVRFGDSGGD